MVLRFALRRSDPGFLDSGLFVFGVEPVVIYAYVIIMSFTLVPAAYIIASKIKNDILSNTVKLGLTVIAMGMAVLLSAWDLTLQTVNGVGMTIAFLSLVVAHLIFRLEPKTKK
jgi:hypothetical protein